MKKNVGILIFDQVEVLDFAGPFEVFSVASEIHNFELFEVFTISKSKKAITTVNGMSVNPKYSFSDCPPIDILIISGGNGTRALIEDAETMNWVLKQHEKSQLIMSICSGSRVLGKLGLLTNKAYCTHKEVYEDMIEMVPSGIPMKEQRYTKTSDKIYTSGGISAGIDLSFSIVSEIYGNKTVLNTAAYMEYILNDDYIR